MRRVQIFKEKSELLSNLLTETINANENQLERGAELFSNTLKSGNTIFWCGNGGSASEASHLATELIGRFKDNRIALPSISLNADTTAITCIANDFGYDEIYSRQLQGLGRPNDLLVTLSTSGKSRNIIRALEQAAISGLRTIALLGKGGGEALNLAEISILVPGSETARIQEIHLLVGHTLCELTELEMGF
jgi:D-sedoheptulose 7-phosphate isomerase